MTEETLQRHLEFLVVFFSAPDKDFYGEVYDGTTPLGVLETPASREDFAVAMMTAATELFVNSQHSRPLFPLASEYLDDKAERERFLGGLVEAYRAQDKTVTGYPPDHLRVLYEFELYLLEQQDHDGAGAFYTQFIKGWTTRFADAVIKRNPPELFRRVALMVRQIGTLLDKLGHSVGKDEGTKAEIFPGSGQLMNRLPESVYDGILVIDTDFNIIYANKRFASIYDTSPENIIGKKCTDIVGFDHCIHSCPHRDILGQKTDYSGHNLYCQKREAGPYCVSASPLIDDNDNVIGVVEMYRDMKRLGMYIGSLEDTNAALMMEKARLHKILDDVADGYYCASPDGRITSVNAKLQKLLGKSAQELIGFNCREVICGHSCDEDCPRDWAVKKKQNVIDSHQRLDVGGELIPCDKSIILVEDQNGGVESIIGVINRVSETVALRDEAENGLEYFDIITKAQSMKDMIGLVKEAAPTDAPVLITGETGTGKELVARAVQQLSRRTGKPFVKINCSALTESLLESELFGHAKGAFTGAVANYAGKFKNADGGTIFLDEIEEMSPGLQAKLLRVIEEQEFEPVGSNRLEKVNVRIIAAANQDLAALIESGRFRSDLYYRLNVIRIVVPPLRDRKGDIPVLVNHRLGMLREKYNKEVTAISSRGLDVLMSHDWPGNIRQLFGALEYAFLRATGERVERNDLPEEIYTPPALRQAAGVDDISTAAEKEKIEHLLTLYPRNRRRVAHELGISRTTLWRRIQELGIKERSNG